MKKAITSLLAATITGSVLVSCARNEQNGSSVSNTYVLVHGAWQAPYVWDDVRAELEQKGNKVIVVELPGHGTDQTATQTLSVDAYRDKVIQAIPDTVEKVILVGHSMAGMVISAVGEKIPARISKLVYVGAYLPANGQSLKDLAETDPGSKLGPLLVPSVDQLTLDVVRDSLTYLFIDDGSSSAKELVIKNYRAEPAIPFTNKADLTEEHFGAIEKVYIKTMRDIVISPGLQDRMIAAAGIHLVYSLNTSHSPFLVEPRKLADILVDLTKEVSVLSESE